MSLILGYLVLRQMLGAAYWILAGYCILEKMFIGRTLKVGEEELGVHAGKI